MSKRKLAERKAPNRTSKRVKRDMDDLWKQVFPVGTEWDNLHSVYQYNWNFSNLEHAFEEGRELHGKKVYFFACTEADMLTFKDETKMTLFPVMVAVVSPSPPSLKVGITSVQRVGEKIVDMKSMKMDWVPYIPPEDRDRMIERLKPEIFILRCTQRRTALRHLKEEQIKEFNYCLPYIFHPLKEDEPEEDSTVQIIYPMDPNPVVCDFDYDLDDHEEFTDKLIEEEKLPADQKDAFKNFLKEKEGEAKDEILEAKKKKEGMSEEQKDAFEKIEFYKFYPVATPDTPYVRRKDYFINRYYGKAHRVF